MTTTTTDFAQVLREFDGDPRTASTIAEALGFDATSAPIDLLSGQATPIHTFFQSGIFNVSALYRVGGRDATPGRLGLYVAVLDEWGDRSSERDRARRRVARAIVEHSLDDRALYILVPGSAQRDATGEMELVLPRSGATTGSKQAITTVRALISLREPTRFHRDLLRNLRIAPDTSLREVSQEWQREFSVERAAKGFYTDYAKVRDRLSEALKSANPDHAVVQELEDDEAQAWATRLLGRILFLWFLQEKRWLGFDGSGQGSTTYFTDLWERRGEAENGIYGRFLLPLFFESMAKRRPSRETRDLLGEMPYLNGGLFRPNALEDRLDEGGPDLPPIVVPVVKLVPGASGLPQRAGWGGRIARVSGAGGR